MSKLLKVVLLGAAIALVVSVSGCGTSDVNNASTDTYTPAPVDTYVPPTPKEQFLSDINSFDDSIIATTSNSDLWDIATSTCDALDRGNSLSELLNYLINSGSMDTSNAETIGRIIGTAIRDVCPSHEAELNNYIAQNS